MVQIHLGPQMAPPSSRPKDVLDLLDWKRRVFELYARVWQSGDPESAWGDWRRERDELFRNHPQSPLPSAARRELGALTYFDYAPAARIEATIDPAEPVHYDIATSGEGTYGFTRFATTSFELHGIDIWLELYWLDGYGGGLFLPFRDGTSGSETYGAGRYLLDTVKGADLGTTTGGRLVLDFNFAYNPSCSYDPAWVCPLAPPANRVPVWIEAGERHEERVPG